PEPTVAPSMIHNEATQPLALAAQKFACHQASPGRWRLASCLAVVAAIAACGSGSDSTGAGDMQPSGSPPSSTGADASDNSGDDATSSSPRSEERRVGKEGRSR